MILGQEGDDPGIVGIDPVYYDKELVHCTEERENQTEPQSPDVDAQVDLPDERAWADVEHTAQKFIQQFLVGIHGCSTEAHRESLAAHIEAEGAYNHHGLDQLFPRNMPHTLGKEHFFTRQTCNETQYPSPSQWQEFFAGDTTQHFDGKPKQACLHTEHTQQIPPVISFDIDSILGFVTSPAAAVHGIRFYSAPQ
ncbi:hypothetical protein BKA56DRAFT_606559 [Ilyonectria sp. MPI-CAGE-AT-0026]|nr:hypothetical protein BKA56DRAFT_606559 [Ilyonectria sp. MPI-CAGE-AT-0026]